jgi:3-phenylpropionate/trans-cinnamate dioxygenase ferredoxin reductase subunit
VAAAARALGKQVSVIEMRHRVLERVCAPVVADFFQAEHAARGVRFWLNAAVDHLEPGCVRLTDGARIPADLIVAGVGVAPNDDLARAAGLPTGNGILVDQFLRTSHPRIFAIGDCAEFSTPYAGGRVRLESVQNAVDQAACVAKAITGQAAPYSAVPWFWTDQYDLHLQTAGLTQGCTETVVRGNPASRNFSVFYYRAGQLRAIDSINRAAEHLTARKLIAAFAQITREQAADESFDLTSALP